MSAGCGRPPMTAGATTPFTCTHSATAAVAAAAQPGQRGRRFATSSACSTLGGASNWPSAATCCASVRCASFRHSCTLECPLCSLSCQSACASLFTRCAAHATGASSGGSDSQRLPWTWPRDACPACFDTAAATHRPCPCAHECRHSRAWRTLQPSPEAPLPALHGCCPRCVRWAAEQPVSGVRSSGSFGCFGSSGSRKRAAVGRGVSFSAAGHVCNPFGPPPPWSAQLHHTCTP